MLLMGVILPSSAKDRAQQVIAHRGYWKTEGSAQNSISSLQNSHLNHSLDLSLMFTSPVTARW